jgi:hypothetical protein
VHGGSFVVHDPGSEDAAENTTSDRGPWHDDQRLDHLDRKILDEIAGGRGSLNHIKAGAHRSKVSRRLAALSALGWIEKTGRGKGGKRWVFCSPIALTMAA